MRTLSLTLLSETVVSRRKILKMTQAQLAQKTGMSRSVLSNLENRIYKPSIDQLESLAAVLNFDLTEMFVEQSGPVTPINRSYNIAIAGTGYVGLSLAILLAQHNQEMCIRDRDIPVKAGQPNCLRRWEFKHIHDTQPRRIYQIGGDAANIQAPALQASLRLSLIHI